MIDPTGLSGYTPLSGVTIPNDTTPIIVFGKSKSFCRLKPVI